jgi:DNA-binding IclR family transcriptional regulator
LANYYDLGKFALRFGLAAPNRSDYMQITNGESRQLIKRVDIDRHISIAGTYGATIVRYHNRPVTILFRRGDILPLLDSAAGRTS